MVSRQSQTGEVFTRYRDDGDSPQSDSNQSNDQSPTRSSVSRNEQLLQEVLGETLARNQECPEELVDALREFYSRQQQRTCDCELFAEIVREVLRQRLGRRTDRFPADLFQEVGRALWTNDQSRTRVERLWNSLGQQP